MKVLRGSDLSHSRWDSLSDNNRKSICDSVLGRYCIHRRSINSICCLWGGIFRKRKVLYQNLNEKEYEENDLRGKIAFESGGMNQCN